MIPNRTAGNEVPDETAPRAVAFFETEGHVVKTGPSNLTGHITTAAPTADCEQKPATCGTVKAKEIDTISTITEARG